MAISGALTIFARTFTRARLARAEEHSKLAMAADLVVQAARVAPDDHWADAARKMLHRHVVRMLERESATRAGNVLALKQMRVATRRMRATWRVFDAAFSGAHAEHFDIGLRRVAGLLGAVRDLDVLIDLIAGRSDLAPLAASWRARRDAAFVELVGHLDSPGYGRFIDELLEGTQARGEWSPGKRAGEQVADLRRLGSARQSTACTRPRSTRRARTRPWPGTPCASRPRRCAIRSKRCATCSTSARRRISSNSCARSRMSWAR